VPGRRLRRFHRLQPKLRGVQINLTHVFQNLIRRAGHLVENVGHVGASLHAPKFELGFGAANVLLTAAAARAILPRSRLVKSIPIPWEDSLLSRCGMRCEVSFRKDTVANHAEG
jgi:hypothetical protein